jgi:hypothetical protein
MERAIRCVRVRVTFRSRHDAFSPGSAEGIEGGARR